MIDTGCTCFLKNCNMYKAKGIKSSLTRICHNQHTRITSYIILPQTDTDRRDSVDYVGQSTCISGVLRCEIHQLTAASVTGCGLYCNLIGHYPTECRDNFNLRQVHFNSGKQKKAYRDWFMLVSCQCLAQFPHCVRKRLKVNGDKGSRMQLG